MESMSDVLKQFPRQRGMPDPDQTARRVLADPLIMKLRAKHPELDDEALKLHLNRLHQYVGEYRNCSDCPGLDRCPNDLTGHYTKLTVDQVNGRTVIHDHKVPCRKFLVKQQEDGIKKRIRSFYVDEAALNQAYSYTDIIRADPERAHAVEQLIDYIDATREAGLQPKGLYLEGKFGTGKTFLISYMLYELAKSGYSGVIVYVPEFIEEAKSLVQEPQKLKELIDVMKATDLLVFDDIGAENISPWIRDHVLGSILNYRMNRKPTFYTSNCELSALEQHFGFTDRDGEEEYKGRRIMERIEPFVDVIRVAGRNKRGRSV